MKPSRNSLFICERPGVHTTLFASVYLNYRSRSGLGVVLTECILGVISYVHLESISFLFVKLQMARGGVFMSSPVPRRCWFPLLLTFSCH